MPRPFRSKELFEISMFESGLVVSVLLKPTPAFLLFLKSLALTLIPCELLRMDSPVVARVRASTPALAPSSVSVLLTVTSPATVYVPAATWMVSAITASSMACCSVLQGLPEFRQLLLVSVTAADTYPSGAAARARTANHGWPMEHTAQDRAWDTAHAPDSAARC